MARPDQGAIFPISKDGTPKFPPMRTFMVQRIGSLNGGEPEGVEAHRYYVDQVGCLCFEALVFIPERETVSTKMPKTMAPGTWWDVTEVTSVYTMRPTKDVQ